MLGHTSTIIPLEIFFHIASFLDLQSLHNFSETCSDNNNLVINNLFGSNYCIHQILKKEFSKLHLSYEMCNFLNNITAHKKEMWFNMITSLYNKNIFPQRQLMLKRDYRDFLLDSIITDNKVAISYLFNTYKLYEVYLDQVFERLRYHNKLNEITDIVTYANILSIDINQKIYNTTTNISDIWLNIYSLPFLLQKNDIGEHILDIAQKRHSNISNIVFIVWFESGFINKGIY